MTKVTFLIKFRGKQMQRKIKVLTEGKKVVPALRRVAKKATKGCRKSYPY